MSYSSHLEALNKQVSAIDKDGVYPNEWLRVFAYTHNGFDIQNHYQNNTLYDLLRTQAEVAKVCLNTSFCIWCHSACMWYLINSDNTFLQHHYLAQLKNGELFAGTGLSNAMKAISDMDDIRINADVTSDGYILNGTLPWVSNISENSVFAAVFKVGNTLKMGLIEADNEGISISEISHFIALNGSKTVNVKLENYLLKHVMLISDNANEFLHDIKSGFILLQTQMALGIIASAIDLIEYKYSSKPWLVSTLPVSLDNIRTKYTQLQEDIALVCKDFKSHHRELFKQIIDIRLNASMLSLDATRALSLAHGSSGYLKSSVAYRKSREAQFVSIVTPSVVHLNLIKQQL